jgi:hypothetical protein
VALRIQKNEHLNGHFLGMSLIRIWNQFAEIIPTQSPTEEIK